MTAENRWFQAQARLETLNSREGVWATTSKEVENLKKQLVLQVILSLSTQVSVEITSLNYDEERPYLKIYICLNSGRACDEICGEVGATACGWQGGGDAADPGEQTTHHAVDFLNNLGTVITTTVE